MRSRHLLEEENLQINPFRARITTYFHNTLFSKCIPEKKKNRLLAIVLSPEKNPCKQKTLFCKPSQYLLLILLKT